MNQKGYSAGGAKPEHFKSVDVESGGIKPENAKAASTKAGTGYRLYADLRYLPGTEELQKMDVYVPDGVAPTEGWPAVIYVHGGGFSAGDKADEGPSLDFARLALDHGFAMASVNYRLTGIQDVGPEIEDLRAALRWLAEKAGDFGINRDKLAYFGPSAGAGLTSVEAARAYLEGGQRVIGVIGISGAYHVTKTADYLGAGAPPFYIAHGTKDSLVGFGVSEDFCTALEKAGVPHVLVAAEGAEHCRSVDDPHIYKILEEMGKLDEAYIWLRKIAES